MAPHATAADVVAYAASCVVVAAAIGGAPAFTPASVAVTAGATAAAAFQAERRAEEERERRRRAACRDDSPEQDGVLFDGKIDLINPLHFSVAPRPVDEVSATVETVSADGMVSDTVELSWAA